MNSIRSRLLIWQIGALLLTSLLASVLTYELAWKGFNRVRDYGLEQIAYSIMRHDTQDWLDDPPDPPAADRTGDGAPATQEGSGEDAAEDQGQFVSQIWTAGGRLIYSSLTDTGPPLQAPGLHRVEWDGIQWRTYTLADRDRVIQVATLADRRIAAFAQYIPWLLAPLALILLLLGFLIRASVTSALNPLRQLSRELGRREATLLDPIEIADLPDEVRPVVETLNDLLGKVDSLVTTQRQFLADVAHELNTPLAAIKLQAQLAQQARRQGHGVGASLEELQAGIERAVHLVAQLLQMARLEPDAARVEPAPVALGELARERVMAFSAQADQRGIDLGLEAQPVPSVLGDANALRVLLDNLIDNALRYCPAGARIDVRLRPQAGEVVLEVVDNGPGIPAQDRTRVLERFVRLRPADTTGSGLGMAIVRQIAEQHHAPLALLDSQGGGLTVQVRLPCAPMATRPLEIPTQSVA
jgi:two-component system, OmpR family, sensor kinase